jgi:hypothetical protein
MNFPNVACQIIDTRITVQEFSGIIAFMFFILYYLTIVGLLTTYEMSIKILKAIFLLLLLMNISLVAWISFQSIFSEIIPEVNI